jgi:hypothetical protein
MIMWLTFLLANRPDTSLRAKRSNPFLEQKWIASSLALLAMTPVAIPRDNLIAARRNDSPNLSSDKSA